MKKNPVNPNISKNYYYFYITVCHKGYRTSIFYSELAFEGNKKFH